MVKAKEAVTAESLPKSLREIYQCQIKLVDEIERAQNMPLFKPTKAVTYLSLAAIQLE